ncbi:hypothetical protein [uncultured Bartonella sp.]|uniref:hypothetical protein n=1 Tax=uncultured Bartonella sp. TaxID=104108 RepID=UPI0025DE5C99|nr:hypothetical protein [uncultured Bartonella sp.]
MADTIAQERRQKRLAQQLRANLVRRKQQARKRDGVHEAETLETAEHPQNPTAK